MLKKLENLQHYLNRDIFLISLCLTVFFYLYEILAIGVPHLEWLHYAFGKYNLKYFIVLLIVYCSLFCLTGLYFYITLSSTPIIKLISFVIFTFIVFTEYGYFHALHRFTNPMDLEIILVGTDFKIKKDAIFSYLTWQSLFPSFLFGIAIIYCKIEAKKIKSYFFSLLLITNILVIATLSYFLEKPRKFINDIPQFNALTVFFHTSIESADYFQKSFGLKREELPPQNNIKPKKNIIFITDESLRSSNLSLYGYERDTTPYLKDLFNQGKLQKFDSCVSGTTCSLSSGNMIFSGMTVDELPDTDLDVLKRPTIEQYAKAMGYTTYFLDGQMTSYWRGSANDRKYTDHWKSLIDFNSIIKNPADVDFEIAHQTAEIINSSTGNFIWIWKRGVHFPYNDDFPEDEAVWQPTSNSIRLDKMSHDELVNTYDNAIKYNIDNFFKILVPAILANPNNIIIYTSDHGQNLLEDGQMVTHCGVSKNEANVPLFIIGGDTLQINPSYKATHANIFPTLLDLMQVPSELRKYNYADSLLNRQAISPKNRFYWGMELTTGEKILFD